MLLNNALNSQGGGVGRQRRQPQSRQARHAIGRRRVDAAEAHRIGLVNAVVDADRLEEKAMETARVMAEAPQPALEATKRYLVSNAGVTFPEAFEVEHDRVFDQFLLGDL